VVVLCGYKRFKKDVTFKEGMTHPGPLPKLENKSHLCQGKKKCMYLAFSAERISSDSRA